MLSCNGGRSGFRQAMQALHAMLAMQVIQAHLRQKACSQRWKDEQHTLCHCFQPDTGNVLPGNQPAVQPVRRAGEGTRSLQYKHRKYSTDEIDPSTRNLLPRQQPAVQQ